MENLKKVNRKNKGITLITLTVAICILIIILSVLVYNAQNGIKMRNLKMMQNDIEVLNDKIDAYYVKYGALPIEYRYTNIKFEPQENDSGEYYVIDINALDGITLNYGEDYSKITETTTETQMQENEDVYVIDKQSHHVYYARGIEMDGKRYHTNTIDEGDRKSTRLNSSHMA